MSPKNSSLAYDEALTGEDSSDMDFQPNLKVVVKASHSTTPHSMATNEVVQVRGRITVSF